MLDVKQSTSIQYKERWSLKHVAELGARQLETELEEKVGSVA